MQCLQYVGRLCKLYNISYSMDQILADDLLIFEDSFQFIMPKISFESSVLQEEGEVRGIQKMVSNFWDSIDDRPESHRQSFSDLNAQVRENFTLHLNTDLRNAIDGQAPDQMAYWEASIQAYNDHLRKQKAYQLIYPSEIPKQKHSKPFHSTTDESVSLSMQMSEEQQPNLAESMKKQIPPESEIKLLLRSTNYFLEKANGDSILVNSEMLRDLYDEFFNREVFIPLFKYERFDEWFSSKDRFSNDLEAHRVFKISLERYVNYVSAKFPREFDEVFKVLEGIQTGKVVKKREQAAFSFLNFDFASIVENLKNFISSPKTEILRKTLLAKLRSVRQAIKMAETDVELHKEAETLKRQVEEEWREFGEVELLLSFEETEYYCLKKIEKSPELKFREIWIKYRDFVRAEKALHSEQNLRNLWI